MTDEEFLNERETMTEEWKQLILYNELQNYDISNTGKIRNHTTKMIYKLSKTPGMKNTYEFILIKLNDGRILNTSIHRLMGIMFIPIPSKYILKNIKMHELTIDHIDEIRYHNIITNLQWLTSAENTLKANKNNSKRISINDAEKICKSLENGETIYDISVKYNCSEDSVYNIRYGYTFREISKKYKFPSLRTDQKKVIAICELLMKNKTFAEISKITGISTSVISRISNGTTWKFITEKYEFPNRRKMTDDKRKLIIEICEKLSIGMNPSMISKELGINKSFIQHIATRETHLDISKDYVFSYQKFKVPDQIIHNICNDLSEKKYTNKEISKRNNVSVSFIKSIKSRKYRTDITKNYKW